MKMKNEIAGSMGSYLHFVDMGWEPALKGIAAAGFKNVELSASYEWRSHIDVENIKSEDKKLLKDLLSKYDLNPISMSAHCNLITKEGLEAFKKRMDFAAEMGVEILITGTGPWRNGNDLGNFYENVEDISEYAEKSNLLITLETHGCGPTGESETASGKMYLPIIKHISKKNIKVCYDTANVIYYDNVRPEDDINYIAEHIGYLHMKDKKGLKGVWNFPALGNGNTKFEIIFNALQRVNFTGPFSVEIELTPDTYHQKHDISEFDVAHIESFKFLQNYFSSI